MANRWGIPKGVEDIVLKRDKKCVYCGIVFDDSNTNRKTRSTWEHIINDIRFNSSDNVALCCGSCNASKGNKDLLDWLESKYCLERGITRDSVSKVIKDYLSTIC